MKTTTLLALAATISSTLAVSLTDTAKRGFTSISASSPLYKCHEDCGEVILISEDSSSTSYCDNSTYTSDLSGCLKCALSYDIWQYYGDDVSSAASSCGTTVTPSASSATSAAAATATGNSTTTATSTGTETTATATGTGSSSTASSTSSSGAGLSYGLNGGLAVLVAVVGLGVVA